MNIAFISHAILFATLLGHHEKRPPQFPFGVGETLEYGGSYKLAIFPVGSGKAMTLSVAAIDTVDGVPCWKFSLVTHVSLIGLYQDHSSLTSWTTVGTFISRRFDHVTDQTNYHRHEDFRIFGDSGLFRVVGDTVTRSTPREPLDDLAFFFYLRLPTTPLVVGQTYRIDKYFRNDRNPAIVHVVKRAPCDLPHDVKAQCLVLNPIVNDPPHGMFMADQKGELWLTDDARRLPVRIKSGHGTLTLREITPAK